jgi:hypothetical protein
MMQIWTASVDAYAYRLSTSCPPREHVSLSSHCTVNHMRCAVPPSAQFTRTIASALRRVVPTPPPAPSSLRSAAPPLHSRRLCFSSPPRSIALRMASPASPGTSLVHRPSDVSHLVECQSDSPGLLSQHTAVRRGLRHATAHGTRRALEEDASAGCHPRRLFGRPAYGGRHRASAGTHAHRSHLRGTVGSHGCHAGAFPCSSNPLPAQLRCGGRSGGGRTCRKGRARAGGSGECVQLACTVLTADADRTRWARRAPSACSFARWWLPADWRTATSCQRWYTSQEVPASSRRAQYVAHSGFLVHRPLRLPPPAERCACRSALTRSPWRRWRAEAGSAPPSRNSGCCCWCVPAPCAVQLCSGWSQAEALLAEGCERHLHLGRHGACRTNAARACPRPCRRRR